MLPKFQTFIGICIFFVCSESFAQQTSHAVDKHRKSWSFDIQWKDHNVKRRSVSFDLPAARVQHDLSVPLQFQKRAANVEVVRAVNEYGRSFKNVDLRAKVGTSGRIDVSARGPAKPTKKALKGVKQVQKDAFSAYMRRNGFMKLRGKVTPNHARYAKQYSERLAPLASALGAGTLKRREYAARALSFVQSIPYEKGKNGADKGFRLPLSLLAKNRGDCDSKAVLYLALLRAAHPKMDTAVVYIKGHAFVALGIPGKKGEMTFEAAGRKWVIAEPVGPAMSPIGQAAKNSKKKARQGKIVLRRVKPD